MNQALWLPARKAREWVFRIDECLRRPTPPATLTVAHAAALVGWLLRAQRANADDGVAQSYDALRRAWAPSYPETTGYIICSLLHAARSGIGRPDMIRYAAVRMGAWLVSIQQPDGAFEGGHVGQGAPPAVFNTAQILDGFTDLLRDGLDATGQVRTAAARAAAWLIAQQDADGAWRRGVSRLTTEPLHTYYVRAAWPLARYGEWAGNRPVVEAGLRNAEWVLSVMRKDGWMPHMNFAVGETPYSHAVAYTIQGLLELGLLDSRASLVDAASRMARAMMSLQRPDGSLPGRVGEGYVAAAPWSCTSANAQMALAWYCLAAVDHDPAWKHAADLAVDFNCSMHDVKHRDPNRRGGIRSAVPGHRGYCCFKYTNWAQKFFLDALLAREGTPAG